MTAADHITPLDLPTVFEPVVLDSVDDVVAEGLRRAAQGAPEGTLIWAQQQTDGQGCGHWRWLSPPGGLYAAVLLRPDFAVNRYGDIALIGLAALGAAVAEVVVPMTDLRYGWPNDLLLGGVKVAGLRLRADPQSGGLVLGLAVNVTQAPDALQGQAGSLCEEGGIPDMDARMLLGGFARQFLHLLARWDEKGLAGILPLVMPRMPAVGTPVAMRLSDGEQVAGAVAGLDDEGALVLEAGDDLGSETQKRAIPIARFFGLPSGVP